MLKPATFTKDFLISWQSYYFIPTIDKPTRVNSNSATQIGREITSGNINLGYKRSLFSILYEGVTRKNYVSEVFKRHRGKHLF